MTTTKDMVSLIRYIRDPQTQWAEFFIDYRCLSGVVIPDDGTPVAKLIIRYGRIKIHYFVWGIFCWAMVTTKGVVPFILYIDGHPTRILYNICPVKSTDGPNGPSEIYWIASTANKNHQKIQVVGVDYHERYDVVYSIYSRPSNPMGGVFHPLRTSFWGSHPRQQNTCCRDDYITCKNKMPFFFWKIPGTGVVPGVRHHTKCTLSNCMHVPCTLYTWPPWSINGVTMGSKCLALCLVCFIIIVIVIANAVKQSSQ